MRQTNPDACNMTGEMLEDNEPEPEPRAQPVVVDLQLACEPLPSLPSDTQLTRWVSVCLPHGQARKTGEQPVELTVRIVDESESHTLNATYRGKDKATNVLSFPASHPEDIPIAYLGDLVVCAKVVLEESQNQNKTAEAHWAHMVVHGTLHLLGYDHGTDDEAETMEALETTLLTNLGYPPPYTHATGTENTDV